jgi:hypothetical protein
VTFTYVLIVKLEFWTQGPNSWDSTRQFQPLALTLQLKRHGEGRERRFIMPLGTCRGKRQGKHSVHLQCLWGTELGIGNKMYA